MCRMPRKQRRHQTASPDRASHSSQQQKKQHRVGRMQEHAAQMMPPGVHAGQLHIQHVRNPSHRQPVARGAALESPRHTVEIQAGPDIRIFGDISLIVKIQKIVVAQRRKQRQGDGGQGQANPPPAGRLGFFLHASLPRGQWHSSRRLVRRLRLNHRRPPSGGQRQTPHGRARAWRPRPRAPTAR